MGRMLSGDSSHSTHQPEGSTQARKRNCSTSPRLLKLQHRQARRSLVGYTNSSTTTVAANSTAQVVHVAALPRTPVGGRQCRRPRQYPLPSSPPPPVLPAALWVGWGKGKGGIIPFQLVTPLPFSSVLTSLVLLLLKLIISAHGDIGLQVLYSRQQQICLAPSTLRHASKAPGLVNNYTVYR